MILILLRSTTSEIARSYSTSPCPNYALWKKAIQIDGAILKSSGEFHGDCRITFQVPYPEHQRFLLRFESLNIRECHDRLVIYDADDLVDAARLDELSCRSQVDGNRYLYTTNSGGFVTIRYYTYNKGTAASNFQLILTAVGKATKPAVCSFRCANNHCISADLRCDSFDHCGDNSDELNCRNNHPGDAAYSHETREGLGLSITVTIIISLSVLFVCGVCVCSVLLFFCKRNYQVPQVADAPSRSAAVGNASATEALSSSDGASTSSASRTNHTTAYAPILTDQITMENQHNHHQEYRIFHGKSRPSPLGPFGPKHNVQFPPAYTYSPGTPRITVSHPSPGSRSSRIQYAPSQSGETDPTKRLFVF
ncbi:low-density lipoprotein receptor-related protein 6-like isoform X2 [Paramacrobiotus metropolitanus]|nr:low-density lipoprotein receptor-related protein 6-like isoform X2 [Paramacrobiotus metropolitanus]XP_055357896.1 low-density lipoprotein receptor-related protein 6-like isoform X2 [Paramacrobiotus metropolitanus]